jgi:hypothetical protein
MCSYFIMKILADFSCRPWYAVSATLGALLLLLEELPSPPGVAESNKSTNKKQEKGKKQILIG